MTSKLDAIIFGATGFTGKFAVENAVEVFHDLQWGIAGRNLSKLENVLKEIGKKVDKDLQNIPIIIADVEDERSIREMANKCKIIVNCCGPHLFYGEPVVKACIEAGIHHVDVSGEPQFIDRMMVKYDDLAKEKRSYVVSACAFNSISTEAGIMHAERNFPGTINSIETYWENRVDVKDGNSKALINKGAWGSNIYMMSHVEELLDLKQKLAVKNVPELKPTLKVCTHRHKIDSLESYFIPLMGGHRHSVQNSQRLRFENEQKRPIQFQNYLGFKSLYYAILAPIVSYVLSLLAQFSIARKILLKYPEFFTLGLIAAESPTEATMNAHYFQITLKSKGWAEGQSLNEEAKVELWTRIFGYNPFYALATVATLACAKIILQETYKLPGKGGVISPGYAFAKTSLVEELQKYKYKIKFEVLELKK